MRARRRALTTELAACVEALEDKSLLSAYAGTAGDPMNPILIPHSTPTATQTQMFYGLYGDMAGGTVTVDITTPPTKGTVVDNGGGAFTYTAGVNQVGADSFAFSVTDSLATTATGSVSIKLGNNDAYAGTAGDSMNPILIPHSTPSVTRTQTFYGMYGDMNGDPVTVTITTPPSKGTVVDNGGGTFTYTANVNKVGNDTIVFDVTDGLGATTGRLHLKL